MHRIIVGHDGSQGADRAVALVAALRLPPETPVSVVTAIPDVGAMRSAWGRLILGPPGPIQQQIADQTTRTLEDVVERAKRAGLQATTAVAVGSPARALAAEGERREATLIAVGSRGLGRIRSGVMGSVSAELVRISSRPVLVARAGSIERIVLVTDGSEQAERAEGFLASLPGARHVPVTIMTAAESREPSLVGVAAGRDAVVTDAESNHATLARSHREDVANAAADRLAAHGINAQIDFRTGSVAGEVRRATGRRDLFVLGWDGGSVSASAFGAVLYRVLYGSSASVLIVR